MDTKETLKHGNDWPFDAPDSWWETEAENELPPPPPPVDWAHAAARGVVCDLQDRRGIRIGWSMVDEDVRVSMIEKLAAVIRLAREQYTAPKESE